MKFRAFIAATTIAAMMSTSALAAEASSGRKAQEKGTAEIPVCAKRLGSAAVIEPDNNWWQSLGLGSPEAIIKVFIMKSGCFGLVDRGRGLASRAVERALADSGELQANSNIGKRQVKAADYSIVPDLVTKNTNSGGNALGGLVGGFLGGRTLGALAGGINIKKKEANVTLSVVNMRTTEMELLTEGYARKSDLSFGGGGGGFFGGGFGAVGGGGYQNTDIGQVIVLAYLDAYTKMVTQMGGLPHDPSAAAPQAQ